MGRAFPSLVEDFAVIGVPLPRCEDGRLIGRVDIRLPTAQESRSDPHSRGTARDKAGRLFARRDAARRDNRDRSRDLEHRGQKLAEGDGALNVPPGFDTLGHEDIHPRAHRSDRLFDRPDGVQVNAPVPADDVRQGFRISPGRRDDAYAGVDADEQSILLWPRQYQIHAKWVARESPCPGDELTHLVQATPRQREHAECPRVRYGRRQLRARRTPDGRLNQRRPDPQPLANHRTSTPIRPPVVGGRDQVTPTRSRPTRTGGNSW